MLAAREIILEIVEIVGILQILLQTIGIAGDRPPRYVPCGVSGYVRGGQAPALRREKHFLFLKLISKMPRDKHQI